MKKNIETVTKFRTGDEVVVIAGKDLGKKGTVQKISKFNNKAVITGINMMKKHTKPNPQLGETGGIVEKEAAIHLSNIAIWNPKQKKADRISFQIDGDKKIRVYSSDKNRYRSVHAFQCGNDSSVYIRVRILPANGCSEGASLLHSRMTFLFRFFVLSSVVQKAFVPEPRTSRPKLSDHHVPMLPSKCQDLQPAQARYGASE